MPLTSFWTFWKRSPKPEPQPDESPQWDATRLGHLEDDVLALRADLDSVRGTVRKLGGKIYRGVALGETENAENGHQSPQTDMGLPEPTNGKHDLYRRVAALRGQRR